MSNAEAEGLIRMYAEARRRDEGMFRLLAAVALQVAEDKGEPQTMEWNGVEIVIEPIGGLE